MRYIAIIAILIYSSICFAGDTDVMFFMSSWSSYSAAKVAACNTEYAVIGDPDTAAEFVSQGKPTKLLLYKDIRLMKTNDDVWLNKNHYTNYLVKDTATGNPIYDENYTTYYLYDLTLATAQDALAAEIGGITLTSGSYAGIYLDEASEYLYYNRYQPAFTVPEGVKTNWRQGVIDTLRKIRVAIGTNRIMLGNVGEMFGGVDTLSLNSCAAMDYWHDEQDLTTVDTNIYRSWMRNCDDFNKRVYR